MALEISFTTPPFGLLLFVMKRRGAAGHHHGRHLTSALPFMACALLLVALLIWEPRIALFLVNAACLLQGLARIYCRRRAGDAAGGADALESRNRRF